MTKKSKMYEGIKQALHLIEEGEYIVFEGELFNKAGKKIGSLDKKSGNIFYVIKGVDILASRLHYAAHNGGVDSLLDKHGIHFLDNDRTNLRKENLIQLPRTGYKKALEELRKGNADSTAKQPQEDAPQALTEEEVKYSEKELQARNIMLDVLKGELTIKEIAEKYGVKPQKIYDIKNGKSSKRATADLREAL